MLADSNSVLNRLATEKLFQSLGYDFLVSPSSTTHEKGLVNQKVQIEVARRRLLKTNDDIGFSRLPW